MAEGTFIGAMDAGDIDDHRDNIYALEMEDLKAEINGLQEERNNLRLRVGQLENELKAQSERVRGDGEPMIAPSRGWTMKVDMFAESFEGLKELSKEIFSQICAAKSFRQLPVRGESAAGLSDNGWVVRRFNVECTSPVEARIVELRREADELEAQLRGLHDP